MSKEMSPWKFPKCPKCETNVLVRKLVGKRNGKHTGEKAQYNAEYKCENCGYTFE